MVITVGWSYIYIKSFHKFDTWKVFEIERNNKILLTCTATLDCVEELLHEKQVNNARIYCTKF